MMSVACIGIAHSGLKKLADLRVTGGLRRNRRGTKSSLEEPAEILARSRARGKLTNL
tara:strand:+ start:4877 stop:5047 length:171 start_codon:yes stop_codon:yes gene_type:complete